MADAAPLAGWYAILRDSDGALACLYTAGDGWWAMAGHNRQGLPAGWTIAARVDRLIGLYRRDLDPRGLDG